MNRKASLKTFFVSAFLVWMAVVWLTATPVSASPSNPDSASEATLLSMPQEYLNYTIKMLDGSIWAIIDGTYPMHLSDGNGTLQLPMFYPTPPNTTNIHVYLDGAELNWGNYSEVDPTARHHTAIGDWQMIYCIINPSSADFTLGIHYEHPVEVINGSYTFLYDLNIASYVSPQSPKSTAHFNIRVEANCSGVNVYRTDSNDMWTPADYSSATNGNAKIVTFDIVSEYDKPLLGDIAVVLTDAQVPEFPVWEVTLSLVALTTIIITLTHKKKLPKTKN